MICSIYLPTKSTESVISGQAIRRRCAPMSALVRKRTSAGAVGLSAKGHSRATPATKQLQDIDFTNVIAAIMNFEVWKNERGRVTRSRNRAGQLPRCRLHRSDRQFLAMIPSPNRAELGNYTSGAKQAKLSARAVANSRPSTSTLGGRNHALRLSRQSLPFAAFLCVDAQTQASAGLILPSRPAQIKSGPVNLLRSIRGFRLGSLWWGLLGFFAHNFLFLVAGDHSRRRLTI